ncbi:MAG: PAS domain S-box protein [Anaerolineales bacterium]|jgi:PAS domain S-box-containing protein
MFKQRLFLPFLIVVVLILALDITGLQSTQVAISVYDSISGDYSPAIVALGQLKAASSAISYESTHAYLNQSGGLFSESDAQKFTPVHFDKALSDFESNLERYLALAASYETPGRITAFREKGQSLANRAAQFKKMVQEPASAEQLITSLQDLILLEQDFRSSIDGIISNESDSLIQMHQNAERKYTTASNINLVGTAATVLLVLIFGLQINRQNKRERTLLLEHKSRLESEVRQRTCQLEAANQSLNQELKIKERVQAELRDSETRFRTIAENALVGIFMIRDEKFSYVNPRYAQMFGFHPEQMIDKIGPLDLAPAEELENASEVVRQTLLAHGEPIRHNAWALNKHGEVLYFNATACLVDYHGPAILGTMVDVTEQKRAEMALRDSELKLRSVIENSVDGISLMDEQGRLIKWNAGQAQLTGLSAAEVLGRPVWEQLFSLIPAENRTPQTLQRLKSRLQSFLKTGEADWMGKLNEYEIDRPNGERRIIQNITFPINTDKGYMAAVINRDVTGTKKIEWSLRQIEWLLTKRGRTQTSQGYGERLEFNNLAALNTQRILLEGVGKAMLEELVNDSLDLLESSVAIYEANGDYALGLVASGWCKLLSQASRNLCPGDDREALESGQWHCHESCWTQASKIAIETLQPVDMECRGGIRIYSLPIVDGREALGAINCGYGNPPVNGEKLEKIAELYHVNVETLRDAALSYESRPEFIIDVAKKRLHTSAKLIAEITERKLAEQENLRHNQNLSNLLEISRHLSHITDLEELLQTLPASVLELIPAAQGAALWLYDEQSHELEPYASIGYEHTNLAEYRISPDQGLVGKIFRNQEPVIVDNVLEEPAFKPFYDAILGRLGAALGIPLVTRDQVIGVLIAVNFDEQGTFLDSDAKIFQSFSSKASIAIQNLQLLEASTAHRQVLQRLSKELIEAQELERKRISQELHDVLGQALTAVNIDLAAIEQALPETCKAEVSKRLEEARMLTDQSLSMTRELSMQLRPSMLDELGLVPTIRWYVKHFAKRMNIHTRFECNDTIGGLAPEIEINLYRTVQEALTNVARHAEAEKVLVRLTKREGGLEIVVQDDGRGFDVRQTMEHVSKGHGLGLLGIRERITSLGGRFEIDSQPGKGTRVSVWISG